MIADLPELLDLDSLDAVDLRVMASHLDAHTSHHGPTAGFLSNVQEKHFHALKQKHTRNRIPRQCEGLKFT